MSCAIFSVNKDKSWHDSFWFVHNNLGVVELAANLSIDTITSGRWAGSMLTVGFKTVLSSRADVTE